MEQTNAAETDLRGRVSKTSSSSPDPDLVRQFYREAARLPMLSRPEEDELAARISERRAAIRRLLRRHAALVNRALSTRHKGTVHPSESFREREVVCVLMTARREVALHPQRRTARELARRLENELAEYRVLRNRMIAANLRLVISQARRYRHPTLSHLDLIQEGILGLIRAIERYEPDRGLKFSTYAVWWIWQQLARAADNVGAIIRTPVHWNQFRRKVKRAASHEYPSDPELAQLAEESGVPAGYARAMERGVPCVSLETPLGDDESFGLGDLAAADSSSDPAVMNETRDLESRLTAALTALPPREQEILRLRFGLTKSRSLTLEEIGQRYGVSRERIRQLEARAIQQMREICNRSGLQEYLH